eukprot:875318-Prorocentrum_minimum.AAC.3
MRRLQVREHVAEDAGVLRLRRVLLLRLLLGLLLLLEHGGEGRHQVSGVDRVGAGRRSRRRLRVVPRLLGRRRRLLLLLERGGVRGVGVRRGGLLRLGLEVRGVLLLELLLLGGGGVGLHEPGPGAGGGGRRRGGGGGRMEVGELGGGRLAARRLRLLLGGEELGLDVAGRGLLLLLLLLQGGLVGGELLHDEGLLRVGGAAGGGRGGRGRRGVVLENLLVLRERLLVAGHRLLLVPLQELLGGLLFGRLGRRLGLVVGDAGNLLGGLRDSQ